MPASQVTTDLYATATFCGLALENGGNIGVLTILAATGAVHCASGATACTTAGLTASATALTSAGAALSKSVDCLGNLERLAAIEAQGPLIKTATDALTAAP